MTLQALEVAFGPAVAALVAEVTDDKSLGKHQRKMAQIAHARMASLGARLVKLADKLHNLTGLTTALPRGWSTARAQAYFGWSQEVVEQCRGTNTALEAALDRLFEGTFCGTDGQAVPCIAPGYQPGDWQHATPAAD